MSEFLDFSLPLTLHITSMMETCRVSYGSDSPLKACERDLTEVLVPGTWRRGGASAYYEYNNLPIIILARDID